MLIKPKEITVIDTDGQEYQYIISRLPAVEGREILSLYPLSNAPKVGDYANSEKGMLLLMKYVERVYPDNNIRLTTKALIDNHVPDAETLIKLELEALKYNVSFFKNADRSSLGGWLSKIISGILPQVLQTLMSSLEASSQKDTQAGRNSKKK